MRHVPASILVRMVLVHLRKTSSTFSPVRALVSRKDSSEGTHIRTHHINLTLRMTTKTGKFPDINHHNYILDIVILAEGVDP